MLTDVPPRKRNLDSFLGSDQRTMIPLPADVQRVCAEFLRIAATFYRVPECGVLVPAARPLRVRKRSITELFADHHPETLVIRIWRKTAVRREITSFGTFLTTLCHEFCHHLDFHRPIPRFLAYPLAAPRPGRDFREIRVSVESL